jgi:hypothetical protein
MTPAARVFVQPQRVESGPVPTEIAAVPIGLNGARAVGLQVTTPTGTQLFFLAPEVAQALARMLDDAAGGIVIAPAAALPPERIVDGR